MANLYKAAKDGDMYDARTYVNAKENINYKDEENGQTALMIASEKGHKDIAKLLTDKGADLNLQNNGGGTALMKASGYGHKDIAKLLTDKGADLNLQNNGGLTALICASYKGHKDIAKLLTDKGADLNLQENDGKTALDWAKEKGHADIVELLEAAALTSPSSSSCWLFNVFGAISRSAAYLCSRLTNLDTCIEDTCKREIDSRFDSEGRQLMADIPGRGK